MKVMANSVPKSGTNLLQRLLNLLGFAEVRDFSVSADIIAGRYSPIKQVIRGYGTQRVKVGIDAPVEVSSRWLERRIDKLPEGTVFTSHCPYDSRMADILLSEGVRVVCIVRDPRDVLVSHMHFLKQTPQHRFYKGYMKLSSDYERLMTSILGGELGNHTLLPLAQRYLPILEWSRKDGALLIRFEDIVGPEGGGSYASQRQVIEQVADYLNTTANEHLITRVQKNLFGNTNTFRKGQIGEWKSVLASEHIVALKKTTGKILFELGYEETEDW